MWSPLFRNKFTSLEQIGGRRRLEEEDVCFSRFNSKLPVSVRSHVSPAFSQVLQWCKPCAATCCRFIKRLDWCLSLVLHLSFHSTFKAFCSRSARPGHCSKLQGSGVRPHSLVMSEWSDWRWHVRVTWTGSNELPLMIAQVCVCVSYNLCQYGK